MSMRTRSKSPSLHARHMSKTRYKIKLLTLESLLGLMVLADVDGLFVL